MKKTFCLLAILIFFLFATIATAQFTFETSFGTIDDDVGYSLFQCDDNGYLMVGYTDNYYTGYADMYVVRTSQSGNLLWSDTLGDQLQFDRAIDGIQTYDLGYIICGIKDEYQAEDFDRRCRI